MGLKRAAVAAPKPVVVADKYPVQVIEKEHEGKKFLRITNNEQNYKYDGFSGANKLKQLFAIDKEGDAVLCTAAAWMVEQGAITREQLVAWYEKFGSQLEQMIRGEDDSGEFTRPR